MTHVSEADIERFTEGDCHILSCAIHRLTGWSLVSVDDLHMCVHMPDGRLLDVLGAHTYEHMAAAWCVPLSAVWHETDSPETVRREWGLQFGRWSHLRAYWLARHLISLYT